MQDIVRIKIVSGVDIIIAILLLIAGIFITILGVDYLNMVTMYSSYSGYSSYNPFTTFAIPWCVIIFGIATIVYGIKRALDDVLKMMANS
jgi:hypothetical protein